MKLLNYLSLQVRKRVTSGAQSLAEKSFHRRIGAPFFIRRIGCSEVELFCR